MKRVSEPELHHDLDRYLDQSVEDGMAILVIRQGGKGDIVILSETGVRGWQETAFLLGNPANAKRLLQSIQEADAGLTRERALACPKASR
ncbi:MAG: type II toxin-antitoxin system Phd/YefM family antitoxin [Rhodopila sp.]|nr:type II toxin-antitoxin system Phd/YefM family antitoxin [Rhodopila sp.]